MVLLISPSISVICAYCFLLVGNVVTTSTIQLSEHNNHEASYKKIEEKFATLFEKHSPSALTKLDKRIVGGVQVRIEDLPYQVSLQFFWAHICGATLVLPRFIVTAAHCTDGIHDASAFKVRAGSSIHNYGGILRSVKRVHQHPQYDSSTIDYDVSVIELYTPIYSSMIAAPIQLMDAGQELHPGTPAIVSGWGYLMENGQGPLKLHVVSVPIVSREKCVQAYSDTTITQRMLCAGVTDEGGKDACQGDSGGPLVALGKLAGIVSWGYGCARPKYPGVYTKVAALRDFIDNVQRH